MQCRIQSTWKCISSRFFHATSGPSTLTWYRALSQGLIHNCLQRFTQYIPRSSGMANHQFYPRLAKTPTKPSSNVKWRSRTVAQLCVSSLRGRRIGRVSRLGVHRAPDRVKPTSVSLLQAWMLANFESELLTVLPPCTFIEVKAVQTSGMIAVRIESYSKPGV